MRSYRLLALALIAALVVPLGAGTPALAAGIQPVSNTSAGARALAAAMVADPATLVDARFAAVPAAGTPHGVADHLSFFPTAGPSFGILSTGDAGLADDENAQPNAGADLQGPALPARGATALDVTTLAIDLRAPDGANCVRFDFAFYSEEFPEYVGQRFNDAFIAELNKTTWTASSAISAPDNFAFDDRSAEVSVNSSGATSMSLMNAGGTIYDGATALLQAATPIAARDNTLYLSIFDQGDRVYDSAAFVDNIRFETVANPSVGCKPGAEPVLAPLVLIPGIGGSLLSNQSGQQWPQLERTYTENLDTHLLTLGLDSHGNAPQGPEDPAYVRSSGIFRKEPLNICELRICEDHTDKEGDAYATAIEYLKRAGYVEDTPAHPQDATLFPFDYDWRLSVEDQAPSLLALIDRVRQQTGAQRVDILAHSMGGLVARVALASPQSDGKIRRVLTLGTPVLGSAKTFGIMEFRDPCFAVGREWWMLWKARCFIDEGTAQTLVRSWPGAYQLLPGRSYQKAVRAPLSIDRDTTGDGANEGDQSFEQWTGRLSNQDLAPVVDKFHETYDNLTPRDSAVIYARVVGDGEGNTITAISEHCGWSWNPFECSVKYELVRGPGDGTVPRESADLYNPGKSFDMRNGTASVYAGNVEHGDLVKDADVLDYALSFFGVAPPLPPTTPSPGPAPTPKPQPIQAWGDRARPAAGPHALQAGQPKISDTPHPFRGVELEAGGPLEVLVRNTAGQVTGQDPSVAPRRVVVNIPGSSYAALADTQSFFMNGDGTYHADLRVVGGEAARLRVRTYQQDRMNGQAVFNVAAPVSATLSLDFATAQDLAQLRLGIDRDGDGALDDVLAPTSVISGTAADDLMPPSTVSAAEYVPAAGAVRVTLTATDNPGGSGVAAIFYSLDGGPAQPTRYAGPFAVPGGATVRFASVDNAGNVEPPHALTAQAPEQPIAFVSGRDGNLEIYAMRPDGSGQRRLTSTPAAEGWPSLSADGRQIVFWSARDGNKEIYLMSADGSNQRRLTASAGDDEAPAISPDGRSIAFQSARDGNVEIYVMSADGTNLRRLTASAGDDRSPTWSPDGTSIAFVSARNGKDEIYAMRADGTNLRRLTQNSSDDRGPAWSPDGGSIAFHSNRDGNFEIYRMNADGTGQRRLTNNKADDRSPAWSPDGQRIVFMSTRGGNKDIYVMGGDGANPTNLTNHPADDQEPGWWPR